MRKADRLFRIVEYLKARRQVVRAQELADELNVSLRTIYRDIADLCACGTPIEGEAGVGYRLDRSHVLRPLMFSVAELDALMLGSEMVKSWGDAELSQAAASALDKIRSTVPQNKGDLISDVFLFALPTANKPKIAVDSSLLRNAIRTCHWINFSYIDEHNKQSDRRVRPLCLAFFAPVWLSLGWCEMRGDFRNFRLDRMSDLQIEPLRFKHEQGKRLRDYLQIMRKQKHTAPCNL